MGPTCFNNFMRFANLTSEIKALQFNILTGYPYDHPSMIDMVTRSPQNLAENLVAVLKGFEWAQVGVALCKECYSDDDLSSEKYFETVENVFDQSHVAVKEILKLEKGARRENISEQIEVFEASARVILLMLGDNLNDYVEYLEAMALRNWTNEEYTPVLVLSKNVLNGLDVPWKSDPSLLRLFDKTIIIYNNVYTRTKTSQFTTKYSFSTNEETVISLQMYEAYYVLAHYLNTAITSDFSLFNYTQPEKAIASMNISGPFESIYINTAGQRLAGYDVAVVDKNQTSFDYILHLGTVLTDKNCAQLACLHFELNSTLSSFYEAPKDVPLCGFHGEICDQTGVIYAILVVLGVVALFVIAYIAFRKVITNSKGRSISNPWLIPFTEIHFIDLTNTDGSQHMSIQSLQRNADEKARLQSLARTKQIATVDQSYMLVDKFVMRDKIRFDRYDANMLYQMKSHLQHDNLNGFGGLSFDKASHIFIIWSQCFRGSLHDHIFTKERQRGTSNNFEGAFLRDILKGLEYLHASALNYHGNLTLHNCLLDSHWIVKLSGFGVNRLLVKWKSSGQIFTEDHTPVIKSEELHYFDPAIKKIWKNMTGTKADNGLITPVFGRKCDMYSFGVILHEVIFKKKFVENFIDSPKDLGEDDSVLIDDENDVQASKFPLPIVIPEGIEVHNDLVKMLENCFGANRPDVPLARKITDTVLKMSGSLVDLMIKNLTAYTQGLSETVAIRTAELTAETEKNDQLLMELLPPSIATDLKLGIRVDAKTYKQATILYSDIVGFTSLCSESEPIEVVTLLQGMYQRFDLIISQQGGYKMETIGDAYCVAAGLPKENGHLHVEIICMIALLQRESLHNFEIPHRPGQYLNCRWGFNTGEVFSGVIGQRAPRYACFGEAVALASKMESNGKEDRIQMTLASQQLLDDFFPRFIVSSRGGITIDGYGHLLTYWLEGDDDKTQYQVAREEIKDRFEKLNKNGDSSPSTSAPNSAEISSDGRPKDKMTLAKEKVLAERKREEERMLQEQTIHEALGDAEEQVELAQVLVDDDEDHGKNGLDDLRSTLSSPTLEDEDDGEEEEVGKPIGNDARINSQASTIPET
uniref:guanylate cyclase n=1 Tax=Caenorhabditis japonica TaxID=281687 RepID=A0A8R1HY76_CAEJA